MSPGPETPSAHSRIPLLAAGQRSGAWRGTFLTDDGVPIEAAYAPRTPARDGSDAAQGGLGDELAIVVAHGFTGSLDRPAVRRVARAFAHSGAVVTFSFRGHGGSGGRSTLGDREVLDLAAAVRWTRALGHRRVATVGFSMGGSVVLRHAALYGPRGARDGTEREPSPGGRTEAHTDAVVSVSAPARWYYRGTAPMRRLHWVVTRRTGRLVGRYGLRTRIDPRGWGEQTGPWREHPRADGCAPDGTAPRADGTAPRAGGAGPKTDPLPPVEAVPLVAPTPLLIVHGDQDPYFPVDHPLSLAAAAQGAAELWLEPGLGHAENAVGGPLLARIADWLTGSPGTSPGGGPDSPSWGGHAPRVPTGQRQEPPMAAAGTIRYWAAAKAAAGIAEEPYEAATLAEALDSARRRHADRPEFAQVLVRCSFLVNGDPVGTRGHDTVTLAEGGTVEVLPPFAGG